jgi:DNA-binding NarL/FixJ family response regulator
MVPRRRMESSQPTPVRIIIADDHPLYRSAVRSTLEKHSGSWEVVAEATDGLEVVELCRSLSPDLVLMDVAMPRMGGLEATRALKDELPRTIVLIMTALEEPDHLAEALRAGAAGYVIKTAPAQQIVGAVRQALDGEYPLNHEVAKRLLLDLVNEEHKERLPSQRTPESPPIGAEYRPEALPSSLSAREVEVLRLVARGQTNQQIAENLLLSVSTVKKHVRQIISKLGVSDRTQAAIRALELGLRLERDE